MSEFNPEAVKAKLDHLYNKGFASKAREVLLEPWPGMEADMDCLYHHLILEGNRNGDIPLFFKSCEFTEDGISYELPDWMTFSAQDFVGRYGEVEGRLRHQKAVTVFAERVMKPDGRINLQSDITKAAATLGIQ